jgi:hypothetical protein
LTCCGEGCEDRLISSEPLGERRVSSQQETFTAGSSGTLEYSRSAALRGSQEPRKSIGRRKCLNLGGQNPIEALAPPPRQWAPPRMSSRASRNLSAASADRRGPGRDESKRDHAPNSTKVARVLRHEREPCLAAGEGQENIVSERLRHCADIQPSSRAKPRRTSPDVSQAAYDGVTTLPRRTNGAKMRWPAAIYRARPQNARLKRSASVGVKGNTWSVSTARSSGSICVPRKGESSRMPMLAR